MSLRKPLTFHEQAAPALNEALKRAQDKEQFWASEVSRLRIDLQRELAMGEPVQKGEGK